jgi:hypothetical protein
MIQIVSLHPSQILEGKTVDKLYILGQLMDDFPFLFFRSLVYSVS